jgi:hypothetical protein
LAWTRLVQIKPYINLMINHLHIHNDSNIRKDGKKLRDIMLTEPEWNLIIELLQVLGPIEEATTCLGGSKYVTHSLLYRLIENLKKRFKPNKNDRISNELDFNTEDDIFDEFEYQEEFNNDQNDQDNINIPVNTYNLLNQVKKNIYQALCHYFPIPSSNKLLSTLLDPRCKKLEDFDYLVRLDVENKLRELYEEKKALEQNEEQTQTDDIVDECSNTVINLLYVPSLIKSLDKEEAVQDEVKEYLDLAPIGLSNNPLTWWELHSTKFPILSELSRIYLAMPATSTPSERLFSEAGNLLTTKRTRILPELFKRMIFLKKNINKFESIYPS